VIISIDLKRIFSLSVLGFTLVMAVACAATGT
jgi:hypothetical protein